MQRWWLRDTTKDTHELYESHYRLKKLKCPFFRYRKPRTSQLIVLRYSLLTTKKGTRGILGVRGSSMTTVTTLPITININYKRWHRTCQEAGLVGRIPHNFRRTAARSMVKTGIPERVAMQMSGHKTRSIFDRYHIVADADLQEAAKRLEQAMPRQTMTITPIPSANSVVSA
jgi:integrase